MQSVLSSNSSRRDLKRRAGTSIAGAQADAEFDFFGVRRNPLEIDLRIDEHASYSSTNFSDTEHVQLAQYPTASVIPSDAADVAADDEWRNNYAIDSAPALPGILPEDWDRSIRCLRRRQWCSSCWRSGQCGSCSSSCRSSVSPLLYQTSPSTHRLVCRFGNTHFFNRQILI
ncbi:hypothetical protein FVE85_9662 [Porphyridium purpureum]|uniref:Uncharacterized protein n=1 Tax=Porphyridium purpureum TaxID=35688 RepID=A0A5J4YKH6_PORPP|nr:hypothetical protein FVE85_9662 [Porphyridium purpureum]|eukprot:POR1259..scf246_12